MKKTFKMQDLECANCAAKMEAAISRLPGVHSASISFLTQKFVLEAEDDKFDDIVTEAAKICRKIEPDCRVIVK